MERTIKIMLKKLFVATKTEFRFRLGIFMVIYMVGFFAPWNIVMDKPWRAMWSQPGFWVMRQGWADFGIVTLWVTIAAAACALGAAVLRLWGAAYMGSGVVHDTAMHGGAVVAGGPYRYLRNPLYAGGFLGLLALTVIMPVSGGIFAVVAAAWFNLRLIGAEEEFLRAKLGAPYAEYVQRVPRIFPSLKPRVPEGGAKPDWMGALLGELYPVGAAVIYLTVAWQYNTGLLGRCILIAFGLSLVARGFVRPKA